MARPRKPPAPDLRQPFRIDDPLPELLLTPNQWKALAIEIEGFDPHSDRRIPSSYSGVRLSNLLYDRYGLRESPQMVNKWRKQPEYRLGFFRLLEQKHWPELQKELTAELEADMRQRHTRSRNKNPTV
jgi:hypothetical protein